VWIKFVPWQKVFVNEAGCFNNVHILNKILRAAKKKGLVAVQPDISKAFDTIPHKVTGDALWKKGISKFMAQQPWIPTRISAPSSSSEQLKSQCACSGMTSKVIPSHHLSSMWCSNHCCCSYRLCRDSK
jgi:hypothetical protein